MKTGDRVVSTLKYYQDDDGNPALAGVIEGILEHDYVGTLYHVRWDDPGMDDDYCPASELELEDEARTRLQGS